MIDFKVDIMLPGLDALETRKKMLSTDPDLQVIMLTGEITVNNGNLTVIAPDTIDVRLTFDRQDIGTDPQYDDDIYFQEIDGAYRILRREEEESEINLSYFVTIPNGQLRLDVNSD